MAHPVPTAKTALKTTLAARAAWAAVDLRDGGPTEAEDVTADAFWFEPTEFTDSWASLGNPTGGNRRRIIFRLGFVIAILRYGDDERTTEDSAWALYDDLKDAIRANPSLGGVVQKIDDITGRQLNAPAAPLQWQSAVVGSISCTSKHY